MLFVVEHFNSRASSLVCCSPLRICHVVIISSNRVYLTSARVAAERVSLRNISSGSTCVFFTRHLTCISLAFAQILLHRSTAFLLHLVFSPYNTDSRRGVTLSTFSSDKYFLTCHSPLALSFTPCFLRHQHLMSSLSHSAPRIMAQRLTSKHLVRQGSLSSSNVPTSSSLLVLHP